MIVCGVAQLVLLYLAWTLFGAPTAAVLSGYTRLSAGRLALVACVALVSLPALGLLLPVAAKWLLIGRFRPGRYPLWGWYYCRWWLVGKLLSMAPLDYLAGSPLLAPYLRLLGTRIGSGCHLGSSRLQLPDLLEIGDGVSIGYGADLESFLVEDGWLYLEPIQHRGRRLYRHQRGRHAGGQAGQRGRALGSNPSWRTARRFRRERRGRARRRGA